MKIEIAQIQTDPGCIEQNTEKIIQAIRQAKNDKADLVIFPELTIPGYMCMDLVLQPGFVRENLEALHCIAKETQGIAAIVGFIDQDENKIGPDGTPTRYNSAAFINDTKIKGVEDKTLIPNYDVFFESRFFAGARKRRVYNFQGFKLGIEICEDSWDTNYSTKVSEELVKKGANIFFNLSASPFHEGKRAIRENLLKSIVAKYKLPFVYTNLVGSQDGYDGQLVFDGQSLAYDGKGSLIGQGKAFEENRILIDLDNPKIIAEKETDNIEDLYNALVLGTKEYFKKSGFKKAVIGLSGGIDSALVATLAVDALGVENVKGIAMPSKFSSPGSVEDARILANNLGLNFKIIPIEEVFGSLEQTLSGEFSGLPKDVTEENMQARIRGIILMAEANKFNCLVLSTGNKTEMALGYTTLYGDMCGGLAVISDVDKLKVYELARYKNRKEQREIIPQTTIDKAPSAELRTEQTDENSLGASYDIIVPIVNRIIEDRQTIDLLGKSFSKPLVKRLSRLICLNEYKRRQAPPGIKVTSKAFGSGRRMPISHSFNV